MLNWRISHLTRLLVTVIIAVKITPGVESGPAKHNVTIGDRIYQTQCTYVDAQTNKLYENVVSLDKPMAYTFYVDRQYIQSSHVSGSHSQQTTNLRVNVGTSPDANLQYPVLFAVRQQKFISTLEVPTEAEIVDSYPSSRSKSRTKPKPIHYHAAKTLCIDTNDPSSTRTGRNITVRVTTQSRTMVRFYVSLKLTQDFQLILGKELTFDVSPTAARFYGFSFARPDLTQVKIRATSESTDCLTISVQSPQCPIYDMERNVRYQGLWQTMSTTAAMTVQKMNLFAEGFVLVFVSHADKEVCGRKGAFSTDTTSTNANISRVQPEWGDASYISKNASDYQWKTIKLLITDESRISAWIILLCLLLPIATTFLTALAVLCLFRNRHEWMVDILREKFSTSSPAVSEYLVPSRNTIISQSITDDGRPMTPGYDSPVDQTMAVAEMLLNEMMADTSTSMGSMRMRRPPGSPVSRQGDEPESCIRWKANLYIAHFKCKKFEDVKKFSKRFYWTIGIVAIFYSIPVYQLVLHYLRVLYRTGEYDICYYNYLCAQRLGVLIDFNHFWSNASYVIFGILYIFIVRQRSRNLCLPEQQHHHHKDRRCDRLDGNDEPAETNDSGGSGCCSRSNRDNSPGKGCQTLCCCPCSFSRICFRWDHGVPAHYGVFYALGVALTMEGFLSAAYHLCPNQSTFQFDTCFMYVIAVLLLLKIYQFRHPVHFGANQTFAILAGFVITSVLGLLFEQGTDNAIFIFKCIFLSIQYILTVLLWVYYYAVGYVRDENGDIITDCRIFGNLGQLKSQRINGDRLIFPLVSLSICVAVLVYAELAKIGFASYLLYLLVGNVLGATLYYVGIMKPLHGEFKNRTWVQPVLYFIASGVIGGWSLQYFVRAPAQWELSASASRAENEECLTGWFPFYPFYDSHDAWHFLSAAALFLAFMGLIIVDDDLITTPQHKIPVF